MRMPIAEGFTEMVGGHRSVMVEAFPELILGDLPALIPDVEPGWYAIWWPYQTLRPRGNGADGLPDLRPDLVVTGFVFVQDDGLPVYCDLLPTPEQFWEPGVDVQ